jgi:nicotinamide mononucleotide transporter
MFAFVVSLAVAALCTAASYAIGLRAGWITSLSWLEVFSVFTTYSCTWLCVVQSRWNYVIGAISTAAYTVLFWQQGLYSSAALNAYMVPALIYGWFRWGPDQDTRPVTSLRLDIWLVGYAALTAAIFAALVGLTSLMGATLAPTDSAILVLSILAQFLLDNKKLENWAVWAVVNILAVWTYWQAGLPLVALQYVLFLVNTLYGWARWQRSIRGPADA